MDAAIGPDAVTPGEGETGLPRRAVLEQNYPNPFNAGSEITYRLPDAVHVRLALYDMLGREVRVLVDEDLAAGVHTARVDAANLASGVYVYRLQVRPPSSSAGRSVTHGGMGSSLTKTLVLIR
jgi:hypothetical protein